MDRYKFQEIEVSPNDRFIAIVFEGIDVPHDQYVFDQHYRSIWLMDLSNSTVSQLTPAEDDSHCPRWSPDGTKVAYLSRRSGRMEAWIMNMDGTNPQQLTHSNFNGPDPFHDSDLSWSPDGKYIIYTAYPKGSRNAQYQVLKEIFKNSSKISICADPFDETRRFYNLLDIESALFRLDVETGENCRLLTQKNNSFHIFEWFTDHEVLVGCGETLMKVSIETGDRSVLYSGKLGIPKIVKPDGIRMAKKSGSSVIEFVNIVNGSLEPIGKVNVPGNARIHCWSSDGTQCFFTSQEGISNVLYSIHLASASVKPITEKGWIVYSKDHLSGPKRFHRDGGVVFPYGNPTTPMELWTFRSERTLQKISHIHHPYLKIQMPQVQIIRYQSENTEIESLLVLPPNYQSDRQYPALIYAHGGPEKAVAASFSELISASAQSAAHFLASHGYAVLLPNFRGSDGYGEEFKNELGNYQFLRTPYTDIMAGANHLIRQGIADPEALGLYGSSYGAILTAWTIGQTNRFKAAVCAVGFYDYLHIDRKNGRALFAFFKNRLGNANPHAMWEQPDLYRELSPIEHISSMKTPVLLIETGGERMYGESQARILFNGLRFFGIESYLVYYPKAYHNGRWNDAYKKDYMLRLLAWFNYHLKGVPLPDWFKSND